MKPSAKIALFITLVFILGAAFLFKPAVTHLVKQKVQSLLPGSQVSISKCEIDLWHKISFAGIEVKHSDYQFFVKEADIECAFFQAIGGKIPRIYVEGLAADIHPATKDIVSFGRGFIPKPAKGKAADELVLSGAKIKLTTSNISCDADLTCAIDLNTRSFKDIALQVSRLDLSGLQASDIAFRNTSLGGDLYRLDIGRIEYDKIRLDNFEGKVKLAPKRLVISPSSADLLGGKVSFGVDVALGDPIAYVINTDISGLNVGNVIDEFKLKDKLEMSGRLAGHISVQGIGLDSRIVKGDLSLAKPGGVLTIKDNGILQKVAQNSQQTLNIITQSFKNYHYDAGSLAVSLNGDDLEIQMLLDGKAGKRNLNVVWHDFIRIAELLKR